MDFTTYIYIFELIILFAAFVSLLILLELTRHIHAPVHKNIRLLIVDFGLIYLLYVLLRFATIILTFIGISSTAMCLIVINNASLLFSVAGSLDFVMVVVERAIATIYSKTYETIGQSGLIFVVLTALQLLYSIVVVLQFNFVPSGNFASALISILINIIAAIQFAYLFYFNKRRFAQTHLHRSAHSLSERYQIAENIRVTRQMTPFAIVSLVCVSVTLVFVTILAKVPTTSFMFIEILVLALWLISDVQAMLTPLLIIAFSPSLSLKFRQIFYCVCHRSVVNIDEESKTNYALRSVNGRQLVIAAKNAQSTHFQQLHAAWK